MVALASDAHPWNAYAPTLLMFAGQLMVASELSPINAPSPMVRSPVFSEALERSSQLAKA